MNVEGPTGRRRGSQKILIAEFQAKNKLMLLASKRKKMAADLNVVKI